MVTTTDTDALKERIARSICEHDDAGGDNWDEDRDWYMDQAAAVLPIVAVEVRKAKAEAWDEGHNTRRTVERGGWYLNPYRETGDSDERR